MASYELGGCEGSPGLLGVGVLQGLNTNRFLRDWSRDASGSLRGSEGQGEGSPQKGDPLSLDAPRLKSDKEVGGS